MYHVENLWGPLFDHYKALLLSKNLMNIPFYEIKFAFKKWLDQPWVRENSRQTILNFKFE